MKPIKFEEIARELAPGYARYILLNGEDLQCAGARAQIVIIQPGDGIAGHFHLATREFYFVLQGRCLLTVDGASSILRPGDMLLMEPGNVHSLTNSGSIPFMLLVFKTNAEEDTHWVP